MSSGKSSFAPYALVAMLAIAPGAARFSPPGASIDMCDSFIICFCCVTAFPRTSF